MIAFLKKIMLTLVIGTIGLACIWLGYNFYEAISAHWSPSWPSGGFMSYVDAGEEFIRFTMLSVGLVGGGLMLIGLAIHVLLQDEQTPEPKKAKAH